MELRTTQTNFKTFRDPWVYKQHVCWEGNGQSSRSHRCVLHLFKGHTFEQGLREVKLFTSCVIK